MCLRSYIPPKGQEPHTPKAGRGGCVELSLSGAAAGLGAEQRLGPAMQGHRVLNLNTTYWQHGGHYHIIRGIIKGLPNPLYLTLACLSQHNPLCWSPPQYLAEVLRLGVVELGCSLLRLGRVGEFGSADCCP